ncbi:MAG: DUF885 family protein [Methanophagales archaeon]|nr:DUF885 family protein [Methanophagales archaeon]
MIMEEFINYCEEIYAFYNNLQKVFHGWWYKANVKNFELLLGEPIQTEKLIEDLDYLKEKQDEISFPDSQDFFVRNSKKQIELIFKAADIQISILSGKKFNPLFLRNELYDVDIEKWFKIANKELENSFEDIAETIGKERAIQLIAKSGEGTITGKKKIGDFVKIFMKNATLKIDDFVHIPANDRALLKKHVNYKINFDLSSNLVMRVTPGERTMYFSPNYRFSNVFLDFILSHDYCGHVFHDVLSNEILSKQRLSIFKTWFDDEFDMFSRFGEGMSCFAEKVVPMFLGLSKDVVDYVHVRQKIWLPLRVVLDMKINVQKVSISDVKEYMKQFGFPDDFIEYNINNIVFHNMGYMSVYYPSLREVEELQNKYNINSFNLYELLLTAGNIPLDLLEEYHLKKWIGI